MNIVKLLGIVLALSTSTYAQTPTLTLNEFLKASDSQKIAFLETSANLIDDEKSLSSFSLNEPELMKALKKVGAEVENIWGDTVLEGPYTMKDGSYSVTLTGIYEANTKVYAVTGVVEALGLFIEADGCEYDENKDEWNEFCQEVTIYERFYMDSKGNFIESDEYAEVDH